MVVRIRRRDQNQPPGKRLHAIRSSSRLTRVSILPHGEYWQNNAGGRGGKPESPSVQICARKLSFVVEACCPESNDFHRIKLQSFRLHLIEKDQVSCRCAFDKGNTIVWSTCPHEGGIFWESQNSFSSSDSHRVLLNQMSIEDYCSSETWPGP